MKLGIDLLAAGELDRLTARPWFMRFMYSPSEADTAGTLADDRRREFLAGRFAAKEAVLKVLGTGLFQGVEPRDISLSRSDSGAPSVALSGTALAAAGVAGVSQVAVSITHKQDLVAAVAIGW
ncbi:holo-ACP synthase [Kibdelosporangium phytohabitans]|uniref:DNA-binding protein n=1 Tax=Kibdelosporangium phytohabitans TaxID=860235 RepID=A0A0N9I7F6_9PSEU|nr:4'-phosphopantetheinyl transferase superfamily protein [Kibdelosporangium phytohabitans]ALG10436.1 DNA-binding protein [Kibdelosporangium phytohabitans]MBE1461508.1 holo-[acyl-carrier protein] synthase [Kibdelosporangium phytohabitans]